MPDASKRPPSRPSKTGDGASSELSLHPRAMAMQGDVVALREIDPRPLCECLRVEHHAKVVAGRLVPHKAQQHARVLAVAVGLGHEHGLPRELAGDVLPLPFEDFVGVVVLLRQPEHPVIVDNAVAVLVLDSIDLGVDLRLIEAVVGPSSPRALTRGDIEAEAANFTAASSPVLDIAGAGLPQREAHRGLVVADHVDVHDIARAILLLKGIDCVEEEERVGFKNGGVLTGLSVNQADQRWPLRLPSVVVVEVSLVVARKQPLALRIQHAIPVQGVRDLDHDDVLLRQRDCVHRRRELRLDARDETTLHRGSWLLRLTGRD
mmetsp:Transcript_34880/g.94475  ORF Transcript_34880/g.94475 Transcript_34880/m.94475 type:complete len:320 (+) Transcript_34880:68-1027(+)